MRYLIIELSEADQKYPPELIKHMDSTARILSEEESLAKFKEIWDDGYMEGAHPMADPAEWEEFKNTL